MSEKTYPVDWEYELSQPPPEEGSELFQELRHASTRWCQCAVGEALFDMDGKRRTTVEVIYYPDLPKGGGDFSLAINLRDWPKARRIRRRLRKAILG